MKIIAAKALNSDTTLEPATEQTQQLVQTDDSFGDDDSFGAHKGANKNSFK